MKMISFCLDLYKEEDKVLQLALLKAIIGYLSGSVAIISDLVNNLTDSSSSLITIIGTKLAHKHEKRI